VSNNLSSEPEAQDVRLVTGRHQRTPYDVPALLSYLLLLIVLTLTAGLITTTGANLLPGITPFENPRATAGSILMFLAIAFILEVISGVRFAETTRTLACRLRHIVKILGIRRSAHQAIAAIWLGLAGGALALGLQIFLLSAVTFPPSAQPDARFVAIANVAPAIGGAYFAVYAPLHEEIFYRGLLLLAITALAHRSINRPRQLATTIILLIFTSAWFGYIHLDWSVANAVTAGVSGLVFGTVAVLQRSIWPAVVAHAAMNFGVAVTMWLVAR